MSNSSDEAPYRSFTPLTIIPKATSSADDENQFSTLVLARDELATSIEGLYKDFNAFSVLKDTDITIARDNLLRQIEAKQIAYDILVPILDTLDSTILAINEKWKSR